MWMFILRGRRERNLINPYRDIGGVVPIRKAEGWVRGVTREGGRGVSDWGFC